MDLGTTITALRKNAGFSQSELAQACAMSQTYLSQIENNKKEPHLRNLKRISEELEVPLPVLFFLSIDESDVPERKKEAFRMLFPSVKAFLKELFPKTNQ